MQASVKWVEELGRGEAGGLVWLKDIMYQRVFSFVFAGKYPDSQGANLLKVPYSPAFRHGKRNQSVLLDLLLHGKVNSSVLISSVLVFFFSNFFFVFF